MKLPLILAAALLSLGVAVAQTSSAPAAASTPASAQAFKDAARGATAIDAETSPPLLRNAVNDDTRLKRNFSLQPPIIPHRVDGYQVTKDFNKCLDCHAREKTAFSQAIPVSETHYFDRGGKKLDRISTRRYFCQQCHVAQEPVAPFVGNGFKGDPADAPPPALTPKN